MEHQSVPRILSSDKFTDFIVIGFSDGRGGRYSAALLYQMLANAEELFELPDGEDAMEQDEGQTPPA